MPRPAGSIDRQHARRSALDQPLSTSFARVAALPGVGRLIVQPRPFLPEQVAITKASAARFKASSASRGECCRVTGSNRQSSQDSSEIDWRWSDDCGRRLLPTWRCRDLPLSSGDAGKEAAAGFNEGDRRPSESVDRFRPVPRRASASVQLRKATTGKATTVLDRMIFLRYVRRGFAISRFPFSHLPRTSWKTARQ